MAELDTYAIDEAHHPAFAIGFGDLTVHEVATDPQNARRAYLSYYAGGMRMIEIQCADLADESTWELVEVGGYLDPNGNDFWGVEAFVRGGTTTCSAATATAGSGSSGPIPHSRTSAAPRAHGALGPPSSGRLAPL